MTYIPGKKGQAAIAAGFDPDAPGKVDAQDVAPAVMTENAKLPPENLVRYYARTFKVINRAEKGHVKAWRGTYNGVSYPEGSTPPEHGVDYADADKSTWLQPGAHMFMDRDAVFHFFGRIFQPDAKIVDGNDIIRAYGDFQYEGVPETGLTGKVIGVRKIGDPLEMPDLGVVQIDQLGNEQGERFYLWDVYLKGERYQTSTRTLTQV